VSELPSEIEQPIENRLFVRAYLVRRPDVRGLLVLTDTLRGIISWGLVSRMPKALITVGLILAALPGGCRLGGVSTPGTGNVFQPQHAGGPSNPLKNPEPTEGVGSAGGFLATRLTAGESSAAGGSAHSGDNRPISLPGLHAELPKAAEEQKKSPEEMEIETLLQQFLEDPETRSKFVELVRQSDPRATPLLLQYLRALAALGPGPVLPGGTVALASGPNSPQAGNLAAGGLAAIPAHGSGPNRRESLGIANASDVPEDGPSQVLGRLPGTLAIPSERNPGGPNPLSGETGSPGGAESWPSPALVPSQDYGLGSEDFGQVWSAFADATGKPQFPGFHGDSQHHKWDRVESREFDALAQSDSPNPSGGTWQEHVENGLRLLKRQVEEPQETSQCETDLAKLMLLYLILGERDAALKEAKKGETLQGFWLQELYGLSLLLDATLIADREARFAEVLRHLEDALFDLREECPLVVRNLSFVTDIQSYGVYTPFETEKFSPGQRVLLYAEVENLRSEATARGYHTACKTRVEIFDREGTRVVLEEFPVTEEYCRNRRRDFFLGFELELPTYLRPGRHILELTVTDLHSGRTGRSAVDFEVSSTSSGR
jgi:hypothetical protein